MIYFYYTCIKMQNHIYVSFTKLKQNQKAIKKHIILEPAYKIQYTNWFSNSCSKL